MTTKQKFCSLFCLIIFSCNKKSNQQSASIDVSKQWVIDLVGNPISTIGDGQWQTKTFTIGELSLFNSLDTANLTGTTAPGIVYETSPAYNCTYPNPFTNYNLLSLRFSNGFSGQIVFKCVVVDSLMNSHFKTVAKLNVIAAPNAPNFSSTSIAINPAIPIGRFRLYYTLSSQSNKNFYTSWGNIQNR